MISASSFTKIDENMIEDLQSSEESDSGSEISLSEKIILESNEKRLKERIASLQASLTNLKEQLKLEKQLWKEDIEKIRILQEKQEMGCCCARRTSSLDVVKFDVSRRSSSNVSVLGMESYLHPNDYLLRSHSIKHLLEMQNYKRKLNETENMCNVELLKVKQSIDDLKALQKIASGWGKNENDTKIQEIFVNQNDVTAE